MPSTKNGFTLIEIIVALVIVGILAIITIPTFTSYINTSTANNAGNNLAALRGAQQNYYFNNGQYCYSGTPVAATSSCYSISHNCGDSLAALNCNLGLNMTDNVNTYYCVANYSTSDPTDPECLAWQTVGGNFEQLYNIKSKNSGIVICNYQPGCHAPGVPCLTSSQYCPSSNTLTIS